jgi:hypothetical protein
VTALRGYREPRDFVRLLRRLVARRDAGRLAGLELREPAPPPDADLDRIVALATAQLDAHWEDERAGWGDRQKYPWPAPLEHALWRARVHGQTTWQDRALRTLEAERALVDPVWGGMYQYSLGGVWTRPHYEKIAMIQAGAIETYAIAARVTDDPRWLEPARAVARYVLERMQDPDGGFYTSQDADLRRSDGSTVLGADYYARDDAGRRALGEPRIDTAVYADLGGLVISALTELHRAGGDEDARQAAVRAGERLLATHRTPAGAFLHAADDDRDGLLHLADQAAMGRALLGLHRITGDPRWRDAAVRLGEFVLARLRAPDGAFYAHTEDSNAVGVFARRRVPVAENGRCARFLVELARLVDGDDDDATRYLAAARAAVVALGTPQRLGPAGKRVAPYLLAAEALAASGVDVTVVGVPDDPTAEALWRQALRLPDPRLTIERSRPGQRYPDIGRAAVYLCTDSACSSPITDPSRLRERAEAFLAEALRG